MSLDPAPTWLQAPPDVGIAYRVSLPALPAIILLLMASNVKCPILAGTLVVLTVDTVLLFKLKA